MDLLLVAPATANVLGKFAHGIADDFLSALYLATRAPVLAAPAMNTNMWEHPAVRENVATLRARGVRFVDPGDGYLACGWVGTGRLAELHLQGLGEPLMHPEFFAMVRLAAARGIEVSTNTNLTVLSERRAAECIASGLHRIHVSIDGATAPTYEHIRVRSRFERVVRNVRRLVAARAQAGSATPDIRLVAVAMRANLHELARLVHLAHELGTPHLSVQHLCHEYAEESLPERYRPMRAFVEAETL